MGRHAIRSTQAPGPPRPFSAGVSAGHTVLVSAQLPLDTHGVLVGDSATQQARCALENLAHQLRSTGLSFDSVAGLTVYLVDQADIAAVEAACATLFNEPGPALTIVGVAWLPLGARLQIAAVAVRY
jgi:2-iminobutanoate/2-iminopropanoate deaminase